MKTVQLRIKPSEVQYNHFHSLLEQEGCKSVAELFRKIAFTRHPQGTCKAPTGHPQEEKNEEREKSPHTPLKEKEARKEEPLYACARTREARFVKPTVEEIAAYCRSRNNNLDAAQIWDFYESKGWLIGKNKMKDWRSAVRTWERRKKDEPSPANVTSSHYHNGRPKLSNHVNISEEERNDLLKDFFA
jgi:rubrerythrin